MNNPDDINPTLNDWSYLYAPPLDHPQKAEEHHLMRN
jgi:hypothetical protein